MGYYSHYEIVMVGETDEEKLERVCAALDEIAGGYTFHVFDNQIDSDDAYKWYDHENDLVELSRRFPNTTFQLRAIGEDGDRWVVVARNGESYSENVTPSWPDVDYSKL